MLEETAAKGRGNGGCQWEVEASASTTSAMAVAAAAAATEAPATTSTTERRESERATATTGEGREGDGPCVLLTGATGFLGPHLLSALLGTSAPQRWATIAILARPPLERVTDGLNMAMQTIALGSGAGCGTTAARAGGTGSRGRNGRRATLLCQVQLEQAADLQGGAHRHVLGRGAGTRTSKRKTAPRPAARAAAGACAEGRVLEGP